MAKKTAAPKKETKTKTVTSNKDLKKKVKDVKVVGSDLWVLICKASSESEGWMKSTKAMDVGHGVVMQMTTQQNDHVAETSVFIPGAGIHTGEDGNLYVGKARQR